MNDPDQPTHTTFSDLAGSQDARGKFFKSVLSFMSTYGFDGVDLDWYVLHNRRGYSLFEIRLVYDCKMLTLHLQADVYFR